MDIIRHFLQNLNEDNKRKFRKYETCCLNIINATKATCFNENCIREKLCPKSLKNCGRAKLTWSGVEKILHQRNEDNKKKLKE